MAKVYTIEKTRRGRTTTYTGTIEELTKTFAYTLDCGHSWNSRISTKPRTVTALVNSLDRCVDELQGGCFERDSYRYVAETSA